MTKKEIEEKFVSGEVAQLFFGTRQQTYFIGKERITKTQFNALIEKFKGNTSLDMSFGGFVSHYYKYKK